MCSFHICRDLMNFVQYTLSLPKRRDSPKVAIGKKAAKSESDESYYFRNFMVTILL